jgi:HEAT repeat protein
MGLQESILQLSNPDECERIYAAEDIGLAGQGEGVDALVERVFEEPSQAVREAIFSALARIPDHAVIRRAAELLSHDDPGIRNQALELLQSRGGAVVPELRRLLNAGDQDLRKFAVDVLSRIETPEIEELLEIALGDRDLNVVITALENVRHCHTPALRQAVLRRALSGEHSMLVLAAMEALGRIGDAECYRRIRERFPTLEATPLLYLRPALKLVGRNGEGGDLLELQNFLTNCEPSMRPAVLDALGNLIARAGADDIVADIQDEWWQELLAALPETTSPPERYQTLVLLGHFAYRERVFETLIAALQSPVKVDRLGAIEALSRSRIEDALSAMRSRLRLEADPEVRQALEDAFQASVL